MLDDLTYSKRLELLTLWERVAATNPNFLDCVDEIESDCRTLLAMDLGNTAREGILNIIGNTITMAVIYNSLVKNIKEMA